MAITINVSDVNADGTGVDFAAYLANYDANFDAAHGGFFSNVPTDFVGNEFAISNSDDTTLPISDGQAAVFESGSAGDLSYHFASHTLSGTLNAIEFGSGLSYSASGDNFTTAADVRISGFGLSGSGANNPVHNLVYDTMSGNVAVLNTYLTSNAINFVGSSGADVFTGYGHNDSISGSDGADSLSGASGADILNGQSGADSLNGGGGADRLIGGSANDRLTGGSGSDAFVFTTGNFGKDRIADFQEGSGAGDVIEFSSSLFSSFSDVLAATTNVGGDAVITINANTTITLTDVTKASLHSNDFLFV